jgi:hypothetical protein
MIGSESRSTRWTIGSSISRGSRALVGGLLQVLADLELDRGGRDALHD